MARAPSCNLGSMLESGLSAAKLKAPQRDTTFNALQIAAATATAAAHRRADAELVPAWGLENRI